MKLTAWKQSMAKGNLHWFDIVYAAVRTSWLVLALRDLIANPERILPTSHPIITTGAIGLVAGWITACFLIPLLCYFSRKLKPYSPLIELVLIAPLILFLAGEPSAFDLYNLPVFTIGYFTFRKRYAWFYVPTVLLIPGLAGVLYDYPIEAIANEWLDNSIMFIIGICFRIMINAHLKMRTMMQIIKDQNQTLELYARQIEELAIVEERNRIARELHDTVGHTFTSTILGMEAVYYQMDASPAAARDSLKQLIDYARTGFTDVRRNIHQMAVYEDERSLSKSLAKISDDFGVHTGTRVVVEISGEEPDRLSASEAVRVTLIRCLQEALTNAKRHGHATEIAVKLSYAPGQIAMTVVDNGIGQDHIETGFGLNAMNNRIASLNGTLEIRSQVNQGTSVACTIPLKAG